MDKSLALTLRQNSSSPPSVEAGHTKTAECKQQMDYSREVTLKDGSKAVLRPIRSTDKAALLDFHSRLSAETKFLRYHYSKGGLTEGDLKTFCEVDYRDNMALVAEGNREGKTQLLGVGRYSRLPDRHTAEVAFVVQDSEQGKGIGSQLLKQLAEFAWQADITYFFGEVLRQNGRMLSIFRKSDPGMKQEVDCPSTCTVTVSVEEIRQSEPG
jgi:GNAT superfamily N-acetyltransferase